MHIILFFVTQSTILSMADDALLHSQELLSALAVTRLYAFSLPSPTAQPLHRFGPYCLGSAIEYSIRSVCWSSKLPCVKSIPLAPGGVVISLKMKLPLVSSPYSSTSLFSLAAWDYAVVRLYSGSLLDKSEKNAAEVLWYQDVNAPQSHINISVMLAWRSHWIILFSYFGVNAVGGLYCSI